MTGELSEAGQYNKNVLREVLEEGGFDSKYLLEWGMPSCWKDEHWDSPEDVLDLLYYFEEIYQVYDNRDSLDSI